VSLMFVWATMISVVGYAARTFRGKRS